MFLEIKEHCAIAAVMKIHEMSARNASDLILPWVHCVHITTQTDLTSTLSIHSPMPWKPNTRKGVYTQLGHTKLILCFTDPAGSFFFFKNVKMQLICMCNPALFSGLRAFVASSENYRTASDKRAKTWERG